MKKRYINKYIILIIIPIIILSLFFGIVGCQPLSDKNDNNTTNSDGIKLTYYTIGTPDKDLKLVNQEINKVLKKKCNFTIEYNKIGWGEYGKYINTMINSGINFDIAFAASTQQGDFVGNAKKGAWLQLDNYLINEGKDMQKSVNKLLWDAVRIDGKIYGIPTNKEVAVPEQFMYSKELIDKYNIDITKYNTLESLEPILKIIHDNEPEYIGFQLDNPTRNYFKIDGYEPVIDSRIPLMINSNDKNLKLVNIFDIEIAQKHLQTIRRYYKLGYINEDAAIKTSGSLVKNEKVFCQMSSGGPFSEKIWSNERGYPIVSNIVSPKVVTNESAHASVMVINSKTQHPKQCVEFLNLLNTDPELRNLINFGIQGKHYILTENDQVKMISNDYSGVQYTQGNWFILKTMNEEPINKWETFKNFNATAYRSACLGFNPDLTGISEKINMILKISDKYYSAIMTGSVDLDKYLPMYKNELEQAGLSDVMNNIQLQLKQWSKQT